MINQESKVNHSAEYVEELEEKLWRKELEARKAVKRAEELNYQVMKQRAEQRAAERRAVRFINCGATIITILISYWWVLIASAGELPAWSSIIPLTVGLAAAYRWGKF